MSYRKLIVEEKCRLALAVAVAGTSLALLTALQAVAAPEPIQLREQLNQTYCLLYTSDAADE